MVTAIMTKITIKYINLGGVGFISDSEYKKHKLYNLEISSTQLSNPGKTTLKIMIIEKNDFIRAVYRNLTEEQVFFLKSIMKVSTNYLSAEIYEIAKNEN